MKGEIGLRRVGKLEDSLDDRLPLVTSDALEEPVVADMKPTEKRKPLHRVSANERTAKGVRASTDSGRKVKSPEDLPAGKKVTSKSHGGGRRAAYKARPLIYGDLVDCSTLHFEPPPRIWSQEKKALPCRLPWSVWMEMAQRAYARSMRKRLDHKKDDTASEPDRKAGKDKNALPGHQQEKAAVAGNDIVSVAEPRGLSFQQETRLLSMDILEFPLVVPRSINKSVQDVLESHGHLTPALHNLLHDVRMYVARAKFEHSFLLADRQMSSGQRCENAIKVNMDLVQRCHDRLQRTILDSTA